MKMWIARDKNGSLAIYKKEPELVINQIWLGGCSIWLSSNDFPEVTFENSPKEVELKIVNNKLLLDEILEKLHKAGLYIRCNDDGFWNCGYDKTVHHNGDRELYTALKGLYEKLKNFGYDI